MGSVEEVKKCISHAFSGLIVPAREDLVGSHTADDSELVDIASAASGLQWEQIPLDSLRFNRECMPFLSSEGFRCLLPAYMYDAISDWQSGSNSLGALLTMLEWPFRYEAVYKGRVAALTREQAICVRRFLEFIETKCPDPGFRDQAERAKERLLSSITSHPIQER